MPMKMRDWFRPPPAVEPVEAPLVYLCGVPACTDGLIESQDEQTTVVSCDTHEARTTHDTAPREAREQQIIRVQDGWRQHGSGRRD